MKKLLPLILFAAGALGAWAYYTHQPKNPPVAAQPANTATLRPNASPASQAASKPIAPKPPVPVIVPVVKATDPALGDFYQTVEITMSPGATYDEKQAAWKKLRDNGQMDQTIAELEKAVAQEPSTPSFYVALGRAYMWKSGTLQDINEVGAMGMKIDQSFTAALKLDPANWDAQYFKAVALSYYPAFMNKGPEVVKTYANLIQQQEQMQPQPHFARTYLQLGEQYQKMGQADNAQQIWQRGAARFPDDEDLRKKVAPAAQP